MSELIRGFQKEMNQILVNQYKMKAPNTIYLLEFAKHNQMTISKKHIIHASVSTLCHI